MIARDAERILAERILAERILAERILAERILAERILQDTGRRGGYRGLGRSLGAYSRPGLHHAPPGPHPNGVDARSRT